MKFFFLAIMMSFSFVGALSAQDINNVEFYLKFEDNLECGNTDYTVSSITRTNDPHTAVYEPGKFGKAVAFDLTNIVKLEGTGFNHTSSYSISFFIKLDHTGLIDPTNAAKLANGPNLFGESNENGQVAARGLVTKGYGFQVVSNLTDERRVVSGANNSVQNGTWHHIVGVYDVANKERYVYFDGVKQSIVRIYEEPTLGGPTLDQLFGNWVIGNNAAVSDNTGFQGLMDDFFVIKEVLSPENISMIAAGSAASLFNPTDIKEEVNGIDCTIFVDEKNIRVSSTRSLSNAVFSVYNLHGELVSQTEPTNIQGEMLISAGLAKGIYVIKVFCCEGEIVQKVLVK